MEEEPRTPDTLSAEIRETELPVRVEMSKNNLLVNDRLLEPSDGPEILLRALVENKDVIIQGLQRFCKEMQALHPDAQVGLAPFTVMRITSHPKRVLSYSGLERKKYFEQVFTDINDIRGELHPFWRAVEEAEFIPDLRVYWSGHYETGLWANLPNTD
jgi:hypothetical protein